MSLAAQALEAEIQSNIGEFLQMKSALVSLRVSDDPKVAKRAEKLYVDQVKLEKDMTTALANIEKIKIGAYTFSDIRKIGSFAMDLRSHMGDVKPFLSGKDISGSNILKKPAVIGAGLGLLSLLWLSRR